ncbi:uncharacterized protein STEHIDRAFT_134710 [Stereum hirsutum FP-91666 SS1]|uniref:uncharacterized protein n=1 Tax=Stereum hirsutum (strain FP-91666) TaxID=721885 RepID=UPI000444955D|nr:uncharacterized protein STEHIDRAFT_134710 [Stereum hirsutum FP-91666 SS1]EIM80995.1 hypothetical protein STEHIDRAFT_134710 [Stereum hirsutum FP-91666 SS1]
MSQPTESGVPRRVPPSRRKVENPAPPLDRGKACLTCRRRKMRGDGARPVCGQCSRAGKPSDCEYLNAEGRSRTIILEERIAALEHRIREFEDPEAVSASEILLHDPLQGVPVPPSPSMSAHSSSLSHSSTASIEPAPLLDHSAFDTWFSSGEQRASWNVPLHLPASQPGTSNVGPRDEQGPVLQLGWFLHTDRFHSAAALPANHQGRPIPLLISTVCLWVVALSTTESTDSASNQERALVARTRSLLGADLSKITPQQIIQFIQAKVLFATYLFHMGELREGRHHCSSAATMVVACGLHKIRSNHPLRLDDPLDTTVITLPEPIDSVEEGERLDAFWTVFTMDRAWAVVLHSPTIISDDDHVGAQVDSPWPLDMESYENGQIYPNLRTSGTLRIFLNGFNTSWPWENQSTLALLSKASALFERASRLSNSWRPDSPNATAFYAEFLALDQRIDDFKTQLFPLAVTAAAADILSENLRMHHLVHSLVHSATIQLHLPFSAHSEASRAKCLSAAMGIVDANVEARMGGLPAVHPLLAMIWSGVCRVFIDKLASLPALAASSSFAVSDGGLELGAAVEKIIATMTVFAVSCPLMNIQLAKVQQAYGAI